MRIIFIFNTAYKNPLFYELVEKLYDSGNQVLIYDFISSKKYNFKTKKTELMNPFFGSKVILKIKYLRRLFIPIMNKMIIEQEFKSTDTINMHYLNHDYVQYAKFIKMKRCKLVVTFWGSDFLRANNSDLKKYKPLLNHSDSITMVEGIQKSFGEKFPNYKDKIQTTFFGVSNLKYIKEISQDTIDTFFNKFDKLNRDQTFVTVGYNASPGQQHIYLINKLKNLTIELKQKICLLVPMTYGGSISYKEEVIKYLIESKIKFHVFSKFLSNEELAALRYISDVTLNFQKTDAFSASLSESLAAKSVVIVGDWLPYSIYELWNVKFFKSSIESFDEKLIEILENVDDFKQQVLDNDAKIFKKLNWQATLPVWKNILKNDLN